MKEASIFLRPGSTSRTIERTRAHPLQFIPPWAEGDSGAITSWDRRLDAFIQEKVGSEDIAARFRINAPKASPIYEVCMRLCKEQSLSNALGDDEEVIRAYSAKYVPDSIVIRDFFGKTMPDSMLAVFSPGKRVFEVDVVFPYLNYENALTALGMVLSGVGGDTFNIKGLYPIKIMSITLPQSVTSAYGGPAFGIEGIRKRLGVYDRPLLCGPVKPCVGLGPVAFARRAKEALLGGADIVKDDELMCNPSYNPMDKRVETVAKAVKEAERETGEKKMYFAFVGSGAPSELMKLARIARDNGADGFMVSPAINGFEIVKDLRDAFGLPIIAHNALQYASYSRNHGTSFGVFAQLERICGADAVITPTKYGTFDVMTREENLENIGAMTKEMPGIKRGFPAFCGGQSPKTISRLRADVGGNDFIVIAGASLYDHPDGPAAGARALREPMAR